MQPLRDLLDRIRWDPEFGRGTFAVGFEDRIAHEERIAALTSIAFDPGGDSFSLTGGEGVTVHIPLHRVRTVYKNGLPIWRRPARER